MNAMTNEHATSAANLSAARGVTLMTLLIVITIIGVLGAIAYPSYRNHVRVRRRADGEAALLAAAERLERCSAQYNAYNAAGCSALSRSLATGYLSDEQWYKITDLNAGANTYTLVATPQRAQTADTRCGNLTLTQTGMRGATGTAPTTCW